MSRGVRFRRKPPHLRRRIVTRADLTVVDDGAGLDVEDERPLTRAVRRSLESEEFSFVTAANGIDGNWQAREQRFDAIVLLTAAVRESATSRPAADTNHPSNAAPTSGVWPTAGAYRALPDTTSRKQHTVSSIQDVLRLPLKPAPTPAGQDSDVGTPEVPLTRTEMRAAQPEVAQVRP